MASHSNRLTIRFDMNGKASFSRICPTFGAVIDWRHSGHSTPLGHELVAQSSFVRYQETIHFAQKVWPQLVELIIWG